MTPQELEKLISGELGRYPQEGEVSAERYRAQMEQLRWDLKRLTDETASRDVPERFELQTPMEQPDEDEQLDVYEQMKQQMEEFQELLEQLAAAEQAEEAADGREEPNKEGLRFAGSDPTLRKMAELEAYQTKTELELSAISREMETPQSFQEDASLLDELSDVELAARAKAILGEHKTFASFAKDKFNQYLRAAEAYLKQGKYYRAADTYTLASIYKPNDPLVYAGKSHALFAAGEYMSSALFLSRALAIFPEYARFKIDIVAMVGDRDKLENRIVDIKEWQQVNDSAELQFLLAYIYYQMDRLEAAKEAIDQASEKMPNTLAVLAVKKAIEDSIQQVAD
jgi:tetratricopeptide (TPR) repeat protein